MATTAVGAGPQQVKPRREMVEAKAPEMFKFTKHGETISGVLINIEPATVKGKQAIEYMLQGERGERLTFLGTNDLNKKLQPAHIGHWVDIRYERDDNSFVQAGQSAAKLFKVLIAKDKEPGFADPAA
jgi:hypothetical protein